MQTQIRCHIICISSGPALFAVAKAKLSKYNFEISTSKPIVVNTRTYQPLVKLFQLYSTMLIPLCNSYTIACPPLRGDHSRDLATVWGLYFPTFCCLHQFEISTEQSLSSLIVFCCRVAVSVLCLFLTVPWVGLCSVIVEITGHTYTHLLSCHHLLSCQPRVTVT